MQARGKRFELILSALNEIDIFKRSCSDITIEYNLLWGSFEITFVTQKCKIIVEYLKESFYNDKIKVVVEAIRRRFIKRTAMVSFIDKEVKNEY